MTWKQFKKRANISFPFLLRNFRIFTFSLNCSIQFCSQTNHTLIHANFTHPFINFQSFLDWYENSSSGLFSDFESIEPTSTIFGFEAFSAVFIFGKFFILRFLETLMRGPSRKYDAWALSSSVVSLQFLSDGMADPDSYGNPERDIEQVSFIIPLIFFRIKGLEFWLFFCFKLCSTIGLKANPIRDTSDTCLSPTLLTTFDHFHFKNYYIGLRVNVSVVTNVCVCVDVSLDFTFVKAFLTLKRGTQLVKYSRKGKPKLCNFRLSQVSFFKRIYIYALEFHINVWMISY